MDMYIYMLYVCNYLDILKYIYIYTYYWWDNRPKLWTRSVLRSVQSKVSGDSYPSNKPTIRWPEIPQTYITQKKTHTPKKHGVFYPAFKLCCLNSYFPRVTTDWSAWKPAIGRHFLSTGAKCCRPIQSELQTCQSLGRVVWVAHEFGSWRKIPEKKHGWDM